MGKIILITGISSGFGKETARILAEAGHKVYGTVRKETGIEGPANILKMDLTDILSISQAVDTVIEKEGRIDVLINNAGMHTGGPIETIPPEYMRLQMETNFNGMVHLTKEVIPHMRKQGGGTIINFGSIGGLMGLPFQAFYSASKFAIEGFSEALRMEIRRFNIKVIVINPGDFCTSNSMNRRKFLAPSGEGDPYGEQFQETLAVIEKDEANGWKPEVLARRLLKIVECKKPRQRYIISSFEQRLAVMMNYLLPGSLFRKILEGHYLIK
jgi:NAD(P)-dependent dehydrogenase (short-subunit alcohol dehydrogenase family)